MVRTLLFQGTDTGSIPVRVIPMEFFINGFNSFFIKVFSIKFFCKCLIFLIFIIILISFILILPTYLYKIFTLNSRNESFLSFWRYTFNNNYVIYLNQQYVLEELSGNILLVYRIYFSIGIFYFVSTGSFIILGSYFLFLLINSFVIIEIIVRKNNSFFWNYFIRVISYKKCKLLLGNPGSAIGTGLVKVLPKISKPMVKAGGKVLFFAGCCEHVYQGSKVVDTASQLTSWKMECLATGENLPYQSKPFVPKDSVITKMIDFYFENK